MPTVSAIVITLNEEKNIERCLRSVQWMDEIIVFDSFSTDKTIEFAKRFTPHVFQHAYDGDIPQRERGIAKSTGNWIFYIDADEEVSDELRDEIKRVINSPDAKEGYFVPRKVSVLGRWILHGGWYPDFTFRLFRREKYRAECAEVHGGFTVDADKGRLSGFLYHYTYETIEQYLAKMNDYTSLQVSNKLKENPNLKVGWTKILLSPPAHFVRKFFSNKGYKDGFVGFILAALGAIYTLALYSKLWEYRMRVQEGKGILPPITNVELQRYKHP